MQRTSGGPDSSSIARDHGINPVVINVAVEDFNPPPSEREPDRVVVPGRLGESSNDDNIIPCALQPSVECNDAILVVDVKCVDIVTAQSRLVPSQTDTEPE